MKTLSLFFIAFLFVSFSFARDLTLSLGDTYELRPGPRTARVWIQDGQIIQAEGKGGLIILKARKEGLTTVQAGGVTYKVQVVHPEKRTVYEFLRDALKRIVGLQPEISEGDLMVSGRLYRLQDWLKLSEMVAPSTISYQMRASLSEPLQKEAQTYFSELFNKAKVPPQTIIFEPAAEIRVAGNDLIFKKYQQLLRPYGVNIIRDQESLDIAPTIKVQITVAEVSREHLIKHGISWPPEFKGVLSSGVLSAKDAEFAIQAMEKIGKAKILASPNLLCRSGKEAEFLAGGEFPIKVMNYEVHDILWKRFGILMKVKPKADAAGRMSISIETEISRVDYALKVDDVPGIMTNRVSSHFDITSAQTIALSGLLKSEDANDGQGLPGLSRIPVIGELFGSKEFKENRSELVIFVRPSIMQEGDNAPNNQHIGNL
ncbi:type II and III secretion system protein [Bdellovibrio sp. NC01]|uniref:type II and III secretion system protein n=1 Tax=Bdellovibrio sp. NC01 TaxID=2220073 RepID=UPI001158C460|nr:type II and III secretion system protein [Bdellovibrio sp. NC01]QDK39038.1 pilus assembly protein [Bdellovibrio sp. NC01]